MAYRRTAKVLAEREARKAIIIGSAIDIISKHGMDVATPQAIAERAGVSQGVIYNYWADVAELRAAIVAHMVLRDVTAIRAASGLTDGIRTWMKQLSMNAKLYAVIGARSAYRAGIRAELMKLLRAADAENPAIASAVVYGAVLEMADTLRPRDEPMLLAALLRAAGVHAKAAA